MSQKAAVGDHSKCGMRQEGRRAPDIVADARGFVDGAQLVALLAVRTEPYRPALSGAPWAISVPLSVDLYA